LRGLKYTTRGYFKMNADFFISKTDDAKDLPLPKYMTEFSAGMDLYANIIEETINPSEIKLIGTGICISMPKDFEAQVRPRSGLALKHGITLLNSPGTIDSDYRGEIKAIMINHGKEPFHIQRGDRIAQLVVNKICKIDFTEVDALSETERGIGGFGHTGVN